MQMVTIYLSVKNSTMDTLSKKINVSNIRVRTIPIVVKTEIAAVRNKSLGMIFPY